MSEAVPRILVTGGRGQLGSCLSDIVWPRPVDLHLPTRDELDLSDPQSITSLFADNRYDVVINAGAYTAVDRAESDVVAAFEVNALGPAALAAVTRASNTPLIQVSTDYVFGGNLQRPYNEDDATGPIGVYGASKLAGELAVRSGNPRSVVLRTAWVLSPYGSNFLKTMLRLAVDRRLVRVVGDQVGCPTSARDIGGALVTIACRMMDDPGAPVGTYHFCNEGQASWAELARHIFGLSGAMGGPSAEVEDIATAEYPTPARRPYNSILSTARLEADYGVRPRPWREAVASIMNEMALGE